MDSARSESSQCSGSVDLPLSDLETIHAASNQVDDFVSSHFHTNFGVSLLHSEDGSHNNVWCKLWYHVVSFKYCHNNLPNGAVGRDFVESLSSEIFMLARRMTRLERVLVFLSVMLQHDLMV